MANRPTIKDLAAAAGVGVATVDRVLNARGNVRPAMIERVADAAIAIGYPGAHRIFDDQASARPRLRLGFLLPKPAQPFYRAFSGELDSACAGHPGYQLRPHVLGPADSSIESFDIALRDLGARCDVIAAVAPNHPRLTRAVEELRADGVPTFALLNDFAQGARAGYLGTDNVKVGRIAAWMLSTQIKSPGALALFVGGHHWHSHHLRETGFRSYLREHAPEFDLAHTMVNLDTRQLTYEATLDLLARAPDLRGLYVAGGGMEGAIAALRESRPPGRVALVVNELTPDSRTALSDRYACLALATPLGALCAGVIAQMVTAAQGESLPEGQVFFGADLHCPESV